MIRGGILTVEHGCTGSSRFNPVIDSFIFLLWGRGAKAVPFLFRPADYGREFLTAEKIGVVASVEACSKILLDAP